MNTVLGSFFDLLKRSRWLSRFEAGSVELLHGCVSRRLGNSERERSHGGEAKG